MKVPAVLMTDHLGEVASSLDASESIIVEDLEVMGDVSTSAAYLEYRAATDREAPHRPYLHIIGKVDEVRGDFPHGVTTATVAAGVPVDIFYEFTDKELADMTMKGMYRPGFEAPAELLRYPMVDLPMRCRVQAFMEEQSGIPILFVEIVDAHDMVMDRESSGYTLGDYFKEPAPVADLDDQFGSQFDSIDVSKFDFDRAFAGFEQHEPEPEAAPELTDEERALIGHYVNVNQRVNELHLDGQLTADDIMGRDELDRIEIEPMDLDIQASEMGVEAEAEAAKAAKAAAVREAIKVLEATGNFKVERVEASADPKVLGDEGPAVVDAPEPVDEAVSELRERQRIAREAAEIAIEAAETALEAAKVAEAVEPEVEAKTDEGEQEGFVVDDPKTEMAGRVKLPDGFVKVPEVDIEPERFAAAEPEPEPADKVLSAFDADFDAQFADMGSFDFDINSVLKDETPEPAPEVEPDVVAEPEPEPATAPSERKLPSIAPATGSAEATASPDM